MVTPRLVDLLQLRDTDGGISSAFLIMVMRPWLVIRGNRIDCVKLRLALKEDVTCTGLMYEFINLSPYCAITTGYAGGTTCIELPVGTPDVNKGIRYITYRK